MATGEVVGRGDMRAQPRKTLENIRAVLGSVGGLMGDVVSLTHSVTDIDAFRPLHATGRTSGRARRRPPGGVLSG
jgi:enamine deaminase RidA (YjgF/YER057c/UK114 family)